MKKSFLGKGWAFPVGLNTSGMIALSEYEQNIEESIRIIIGTAPGERVMRPDFGCRIHDYIFYPNNPSTAAMVSYEVRESLVKWEPRIDNIVVKAYPHPDPAKDNVMLVEVTYTVRTTNNVRNLVYPFYLRREQDL